jgi:hypothetical protein
MTSADMNRLATLYSEIERRLDEGESSSPELEKLFTEVAQLVQAGEDVWFNLDPKGLSHLARLNAEFVGQNAASSGQAGWR